MAKRTTAVCPSGSRTVRWSSGPAGPGAKTWLTCSQGSSGGGQVVKYAYASATLSMRTVSVARSGKGEDPAPLRSLTTEALCAAIRLTDALHHLELPGERLRVGDVEAGAHLPREADHPRRRIVEEAKALRAVVRHYGCRLFEVDTRKKALLYLGFTLESPGETRPLLVRQ